MVSDTMIDREVRKSDGNLSIWLLVYAFCYTFLHILPPFLNYEIKNRLMLADLFDILTPFIIVFLIYKIYRILALNTVENTNSLVRNAAKIILITGTIAFVEGHGMHLAANAIARHLLTLHNQPLFELTYFFDETLGHILWDSGIILLSAGIVIIGFNLDGKKAPTSNLAVIVLAAVFYGFTYFVNAVEGQTVIFTLPVSLVIPTIIYIITRRQNIQLLRNPILSFFYFSYITSLILFIIWRIWKNGFPQFSELGWI